MPRITNLIHTFTKTILPMVFLGGFVANAPLFAQESAHANHPVPAKLVQDVREATKQFIDVNNAARAGYGPAFGCVSGPDHGAMGIHYVNGTLVGDGLDRCHSAGSADLRAFREATSDWWASSTSWTRRRG